MVLEIVHHILCSSSCDLRYGPLLAGTAAPIKNSRRLMTSATLRTGYQNNITLLDRELCRSEPRVSSDLIHSGDSQKARSSSSSRHESRNCGERHAGRS